MLFLSSLLPHLLFIHPLDVFWLYRSPGNLEFRICRFPFGFKKVKVLAEGKGTYCDDCEKSKTVHTLFYRLDDILL